MEAEPFILFGKDHIFAIVVVILISIIFPIYLKKTSTKTKKWFGEVKAWGVNQSKWKYATEWCNQNNMEFKILTEEHLNISYK